jgi:hypothetical protein
LGDDVSFDEDITVVENAARVVHGYDGRIFDENGSIGHSLISASGRSVDADTS